MDELSSSSSEDLQLDQIKNSLSIRNNEGNDLSGSSSEGETFDPVKWKRSDMVDGDGIEMDDIGYYFSEAFTFFLMSNSLTFRDIDKKGEPAKPGSRFDGISFELLEQCMSFINNL